MNKSANFFLRGWLLIFAGLIWTGTSFAQDFQEAGLKSITTDVVKAQMEVLASDWMEGRGTGTKGEYMAGEYIASMFRLYGLKPFGDSQMRMPGRMGFFPGRAPMAPPERSYFQSVPLILSSPGDEQLFSVVTTSGGGENSIDFGFETDFSVRPGSVGMNVNAPVVFAGYGFTDEKKGYDDYKKLDVNGKIVVILAGYPGHGDDSSPAAQKFKPEGPMGQFAIEWGKTSRAEKLGAVGVIMIRQGENPLRAWGVIPGAEAVKAPAEFTGTSPASFGRMALAGDTLKGNLPVFTVSNRVVERLFAGTGMDIPSFEKSVARSMEPASRILPGKSVRFKTTVNSKVINARNVLGYIEGELKDEFIVVGGHYDHLGESDGWIWNGADDNASGTVGVMTIAKAFAATGKKPLRSVIFAAWTAEEKGMLGSEYFVNTFPDSAKVVINLNYDMIARDEADDSLKNRATMMHSTGWDEIVSITEKFRDQKKLNLDLTFEPLSSAGGGSDHAHFARKGIPVFYFMAAMHPDYHRPSDELAKVNWNKMTDIIRIGFLNTWEFANRTDPIIISGEKREEGFPFR